MGWDNWDRYYEPDDRVVWEYRRGNTLSNILERAIVESSNDGMRVYYKNKDLAKKVMTKEKETFGFVQEANEMIKPTKIIYSGRKTIVFWNDGTKTMVTRSLEDKFDAYNAFCAALAKKMFNTTSSAKRMVDELGVFQSSREKDSATEHIKGEQSQSDQLTVEARIKKSDLGVDELDAVVSACKDFTDSMANLGIAASDISIKLGKRAANAVKNAINKRKEGNK